MLFFFAGLMVGFAVGFVVCAVLRVAGDEPGVRP